ncbi:hypothetical protein [Taibaiella helva]|uniref:hypothetical protein n=1 Tax=Taibaiella helva TaxID=2301235 RepID=UPI0013005946|nr:hypothetical protein [Taibaiella helva]
MKKKNRSIRLSLQKIRITRLSNQEAVTGGLTAQTTCCTTLPGQRQTTCCSLASCPPDIC